MRESTLPKPPTLERRVLSSSAYPMLLILMIGPVLGVLGFASERGRTSTVQVAGTFAVLLLIFRAVGKRELGRLSAFEFVTLMLVPEIVSEVVQGSGDLGSALIGLSTLFLLVYGMSLLSHRFPSVQTLIEAGPTLLVAHGRLIEDNLNAERVSPDELTGEMRKQGIEKLEHVKWALLESSGNITFVPYQRPNCTPPQPTND